MKKKVKQALVATIKVLVSLGVLLVFLLLVRDALVKKWIRQFVYARTGFDLDVGRLRVALFEPIVEMSDARLLNPEDFPEPQALLLRHCRMTFDLRSLLSNEVRIVDLLLEIPRVTLVVREDGESNLARLYRNLLGAAATEHKADEADEARPESGLAHPPRTAKRVVVVERLDASLGTIEVRKYSEQTERPRVADFALNVRREGTGIRDVSAIGSFLIGAILEGLGRLELAEFQGRGEGMLHVGDLLSLVTTALHVRIAEDITGAVHPGD